MQNHSSIPLSILIANTSDNTLVKKHLLSYIGSKSLTYAGWVSKGWHAFFNKELITRLKAPAAHATVVIPNEIEIEKMLKAAPKLVLEKIPSVTDLAGRTITDSTLLQLAYGAGDIEMCHKLKPYFAIACGSEEAGEQEWLRQLQEKEFDEVDPAKEQQIKTHLAALLQTVIKAIGNEQFNNGREISSRKRIWKLSAATLEAINIFREEFTKSQPKTITKGMHFRDNTLQEIYDAYVIAAKQWQYDHRKCASFTDGVLSHVLYYVPTNDMMRFCQGLSSLQDKREAFARQLIARYGHKIGVYNRLHRKSQLVNLTGRYLDIDTGEFRHITEWEAMHGARGIGTREASYLKNLYQEKTSNLQKLCSRTFKLRPNA